MGADGVHVGQSDMPLHLARKLLPEGTIIGVSCNTTTDADTAVKDGADYVGIGPVWPTQTKADIKTIVGVRGVGEILDRLKGTAVKAVGIGKSLSIYRTGLDFKLCLLAGINSRNVLRTLHGTTSPTGRTLDGVAIVSAIMASRTPQGAASSLSSTVKAFLSFSAPLFSTLSTTPLVEGALVEKAASLLRNVREIGPLVHQVKRRFRPDCLRRTD